MNVLLWVGSASNHKALAHKIAEEFNVIGIVIETRKSQKRKSVFQIFEALFSKLFLNTINSSWRKMLAFYDKSYKTYPDVRILKVEDINGEEAFEFSRALKPDLVVVSGTSLIKKKMLSISFNIGILNLHTGLSPYIKGGPNCTNWCIATNQFHLIGNTVMWIDEGIDSGNIVTSEFTEIDWSKSLAEIHIDVMEHAHRLYIKAIKYTSEGGKSSVPQSDLGTGKTYYTKDWTLKRKIKLLSNLRKARTSIDYNAVKGKRVNIKTVNLTVAE